MSDRIHAATAAATGADGGLSQAVRAALCHVAGLDEAGMVHAVGLASDMAIMSLLALSAYLMLLVGRVSFGQQAFFGLGAYASGVASAMWGLPLPLALALGSAVGMFSAWAVALPTLRLSGLHYAVATLAFGEMTRVALSSWHWSKTTTDGAVGPAGVEGFRDIRWLLENDVSATEYLVLTLAILAVVLGLLLASQRCRLGVSWRMVGQDDTLAAAQGIPIQSLRWFAAALAGALAGLGGGLYAHRTTYLEPALFDPMLGVHAVGYALLGGLGTAFGPLLGVVVDLGLLEASRLLPGWRMVVFGGLLALFLRWRPRGLLDEVLLHRLAMAFRRWRGRGLLVLACVGAGQAAAQSGVVSNPRVELSLQCTAHGMGPLLDCVADLRYRNAAALQGAQVRLSAHMPSMPMAHSVKPVQALATSVPGRYQGQLELEMLGIWTVQVDVAGPVRERLSLSLRVEDCPENQRCPVSAARRSEPLAPAIHRGARP